VRRLLLILLLAVLAYPQTLFQKLGAPIFYELSVEPNYQSNPLNLSSVEKAKAAEDDDYLNGIQYSSSNVLSVSARLSYSPRLFHDRKSRFQFQLTHHEYLDIDPRSYQTLSLSLKQSLGNYRYLSLGYWVLPEYYLRNYRVQDAQTLIYSREVCNFGTDRLWAEYEHRLTRKTTLEYGLGYRQELYQAPFAHYDMTMLEGSLRANVGEWKTFKLSAELQYGEARNDNDYDHKDRSYRYLNLRPTATFVLPGRHRLRLATRYDQRAYNSEHGDDPLHAGRYQEEFRYDLTFLPKQEGDFSIEPYVGFRERRVASDDPGVAELKSFTRYWFGVTFSFSSVIDMYF